MVKLIALLKRKDRLSVEEFGRRWVEKHAPLAKQIPGLRGYRINLALPTQPEKGEPEYDGTAELWFDSIEEMERGFASPIGQAAGKDADEFAKVRIHIYTEEHVIV